MTPAMQKCLAFVADYIATHDGVSPSYEEIAQAIGYKSKCSVKRVVDLLIDEGRIVKRRGAYHARTLALPAETYCSKCGAKVGT
jgi:SOS-response transcriptional repressor LexA